MGMVSIEQLQSFIQEYDTKNANDIHNAPKALLSDSIQEFMEAELETHLGYAEHDTKSKKTSNSGNGKSPAKTVTADLGKTLVSTPGD